MVRFIYHVEPGALPEPLSGFVYTLLLSLLLLSPPFIIFSVTAKTRRLQETSRAHISPTET